MNVSESSTSLKEQIASVLNPLLPADTLIRLLPLTPNLPQKAPAILAPEVYEGGMLALTKLLEGEWLSAGKNKHGVVFTPREATSHLVSLLGLCSNLDESSTRRILDPAIGAGTLLIECLTQLFQSKYFTSLESLYTFLEKSLFGVDRDPYALIITRANILLWLHKTFPHAAELHHKNLPRWERNFWCGDFLSERALDPDRSFLSLEWGNLLRGESPFTHIIGNPPYGLSRDEQIAPEILNHYKQAYGKSLPGKPNKYLLFLFRALTLLKEGGSLSFLIPNSWLGISSGREIRRLLLQQGYLRSIDIVEEQTFPNQGVETVFVKIQKRFLETFALNHIQSSLRREKNNSIIFSAKELLTETPEAMIPLYQTPRTKGVWSKIKSSSIPLNESRLPFTPRIALQVYRLGGGTPPQTREIVKNHPFHERTPSNPSSYRYLQGRDIKRWKIEWSGEYLRYGPWVAEHQSLFLYSSPRLIFREVLGQLPNLFIGTYTEEVFLYNRSLLHIVGKEGEDSNELSALLKALLLLINSPIGTFYLKARGRKAARKLFPKIVLEDLKDFPFPRSFEDEVSWLTKEADLLLSGEKTERTIDEKMAALYGVELPELQNEIWG